MLLGSQRIFLRVAALALCPALLAAADSDLKVVVLEGQGAINNIRQSSAKSPAVRVEDGAGRPVEGARVKFVLPDIGAGGVFPNGQSSQTITTDRDGRAAAQGLRPNNVAGRFLIRVDAVHEGRTGHASLTQTNVAPAADHRLSKKTLAILGVAAGAAVGVLVATRGGGNGNGNSASPAGGTTVTPGSPVFGPPR
jgi:hypothetical protein